MGSDQEYGPETEAIRRWLAKREEYASEDRARPVGKHRDDEAPLEDETAVPAPTDRVGIPDGRHAARSVLAGLGVMPPEPEPAEAPAAAAAAAEAAPDAVEPGREPTPTVPDPSMAKPSAPKPASLAAKEAIPPASAKMIPELPPLGTTTDVTFRPRTMVRRLMSVVLVLVAALTGGAAYLAVISPSLGTIGIAGTLGLLTLVVWAIRTGTTSTRLAIRRGQLELRRGGGFEVIDLAGPHTPIAIVGEPGHRGWKVLVERLDRPVLEITAADVDPHAFTAALRRIRPDLWATPDEVGVSQQQPAPAP